MTVTPLLLADLGATRARFCHCPDASGLPNPDHIWQTETASLGSIGGALATALRQFRVDSPGALRVVLAVAGPRDAGRIRMTNLDWQLDGASLARRFGFRDVVLLNDLEAAAWALSRGARIAIEELQHGLAPAGGRQAVIGVGTGLGTAYWLPGPNGPRVVAAEAGHMGFAPANRWQLQWLEYLRRKSARVSWEHVVSGRGLGALYAYLSERESCDAAQVTQRAQAGDRLAQATIQDFSQLLGAFAGDLALGAPAPGGIWLCGGVLVRLSGLFEAESFLEAFHAKGRLAERMQRIPVHWCRDEFLGLRGAWEYARHLGAAG